MDSNRGAASELFVPERRIPAPMSISPEARAFLSSIPPVEGSPFPPVHDKEAWRAYASQGGEMVAQIVAAMAAPYPAKTVTHHLDASLLYEIVPESASADDKSAILYLHGGGFIHGGGQAAIHAAQQIAGLARTRTYSLDYRMTPEHVFPAAIEDSIEAYRWVLERHQPAQIAVYGPSAGGNLAPAFLLKAHALGLPMPAACVVHSPAADATESGDSYETNKHIDFVLKHRMPELFELYAGGHDKRDPLISPVFGEYGKWFPPTLLTTGTRDLLLSSTVLLHRAMRRGGVDASLHVFEAMCHVPFLNAPEEAELLQESVSFMLERIRKK